MKTASSTTAADVSRWQLWLVACVCFGTPVAMLLLGVMFLPLWLGMLAFWWANPGRVDAGDVTIWVVIAPIFCVLAGIVGLIGLVRVLTLSRRERPNRDRVFTIALVALGLAGLLVFALPFSESRWELSEVIPFALFVAMPLGGTAWLLAKSWRFLIAPRNAVRHDNVVADS